MIIMKRNDAKQTLEPCVAVLTSLDLGATKSLEFFFDEDILPLVFCDGICIEVEDFYVSL